VLPWFFIFALSAIAIVMAIVAGAANRFGGPGAAAELNLPSHADYYGIASIVLFVFAAVVAPELLCRDKREKVISLYLVHPLAGTDYVSARWLAFFSVMLVAAWLPQAILLLGLAGGDPAPGDYLARHWLDIPRFLLAGIVMVAYVTSIAMLTASFTSRGAYAAVFLVGLFVISTPFTMGAAEEIPGAFGQWVSMFALPNIPLYVNDAIFGTVSELTKEAPARELGTRIHVLWYLLWTFLPAGILWNRYRRMAA
jgi:hypothetical protein